MRAVRSILQTIFVGVFLVAALHPAMGQETDAYTDHRKRVALVIGIANYTHAKPLKNPGADTALIASRLETMGFAVRRVSNPDLAALQAGLAAFIADAADADIAAIYYAGHAVQIDGANYLVPADFGAPSTDPVAGLHPLNDLLKRLDATAKARIILLDACRDNPFVDAIRKALGARAVAAGLASIDLPAFDPTRLKDATYGLAVLYATQPTLKALDGKGANSPFAIAMDQALSNAEEEISAIVQRITRIVLIDTQGKQRPEARLALTGPLYLVSRPKPLQCDVLAAETDNNVAVQGVEDDAIDVKLAEPACRADLARDPGNPRLMHNLARVLDLTGRLEEAMSLYREAANRGYDWSQNNLGAELLSGVGSPEDMKEGVLWIEKASEQGNRRARVNYTEYDFTTLFEPKKVIAALQRALAAKGIANVPATGALDQATLDAVKAFKQREGLPGDGITLQVISALGLVDVVFNPKFWN